MLLGNSVDKLKIAFFGTGTFGSSVASSSLFLRASCRPYPSAPDSGCCGIPVILLMLLFTLLQLLRDQVVATSAQFLSVLTLASSLSLGRSDWPASTALILSDSPAAKTVRASDWRVEVGSSLVRTFFTSKKFVWSWNWSWSRRLDQLEPEPGQNGTAPQHCQAVTEFTKGATTVVPCLKRQFFLDDLY